MPDEASDADGLSPVKDDNEVWHDFCRCELKGSIRTYYKTESPFGAKRVDYPIGKQKALEL